jgi:hypothetical protein
MAAPVARSPCEAAVCYRFPSHFRHPHRCAPRYLILSIDTSTGPVLIDSFLSADLVQDLYLRELKAYKTPALKASDSEGQVQKFVLPQAPASPEEADIASQLGAYETQEVEIEGQAAEEGAAPVEDWYKFYELSTAVKTIPH